MAERLGVGLIGAGGIAQTHAAAYAGFPELARLVAVADIDGERARSFAEGHGIPHAYADYQQMLARGDVHVVSSCTPPFEHAPTTIAALEAGKHVLCEKPMAGSLREADAMIAAARRAGRWLSIVFQRRWMPETVRAKRLIEAGKLGRVILGKFAGLWYRDQAYYDVWWRGTWEKECGGATINHHVHGVDRLLWLMGSDPEWVCAQMGTFTHEIEVEDLSVGIVRFGGGALGEITATVSSQLQAERLEIFADRAAVSVQPWGIESADPEIQAELVAFAAEIPDPDLAGHPAQIKDFLRAVRDDRAPAVTGEEGRKSLELVVGIYKSALTGGPVELPLAPSDPFYDRVEVALAQVGSRAGTSG